MTPDEIRVEIFQILRDELELNVSIQGKRIVIHGDGIIILVTKAKDLNG